MMESESFQGYEISEKRFVEPRLTKITATNADVLVNSIGIRARFGSAIAEDILQAAGQEIKHQLIQRYVPINPGNVVVTHAGNLTNTHRTRYIFHVVITSKKTNYRADPKLIIQATTRSILIADLLEQTSIAIPALGSGRGRVDPTVVVRNIIGEVIELLPQCKFLQKVIFATTSPRVYDLFNRRALADLALAKTERELINSLKDFPPSLYGLVGDILQKMEAARKIGNTQEAAQLQDAASGLVSLGQKLKGELPPDSRSEPQVVQMIIATGGSIVQSISQQAR